MQYTVLGKKMKCGKMILAVLAAVSLLLTTGLLLSLIKHTNIGDLSNNKTFYHNNQDVTLLIGEVFDLKNYDRFQISLTSKIFDFNVTVCQDQCSDMSHILNTVTLKYSNTINITRNRRLRYIMVNNTAGNITPSLYMLEGSEVTFIMEPQDLEDPSEVTLNIFTDVAQCETFKENYTVVSSSYYIALSLNASNDFVASHVTLSDDYICVVAKFIDYTTYRYSVNGSVYQYFDVSYLTSQNLCAYNSSLTQTDGMAKISKSLDRPLALIVSPGVQHTCVLVTISSYSCQYGKCYFDINWSIFATLKNLGVISTSVAAALVFSVSVVVIVSVSVRFYHC